jgi:hypothetical protein
MHHHWTYFIVKKVTSIQWCKMVKINNKRSIEILSDAAKQTRGKNVSSFFFFFFFFF